MMEFGIDTVERETMFLAQVAHESGAFNYVREIASGQAYEGRKDLGNTEPGDGVRYKGRGLIQVTGKANYKSCGDALGIDLIAQPELLETPEYAARSAGWFWDSRKLNAIADKGDFLLLTKRINGGTNGYADRQAYLQRAQGVIV
jgi:putative chitinase